MKFEWKGLSPVLVQAGNLFFEGNVYPTSGKFISLMLASSHTTVYSLYYQRILGVETPAEFFKDLQC